MVGPIVLLFGLAGSVPLSTAQAQGANVRAYVDRSEVGINQTFTLNIEINGNGSRRDADPQLPNMDAFAIFLGSGSSQQIQIANGQTSVMTTLQYRFQATREGSYQIPAIPVSIAGTTYRTDPFTVTVSATGTTNPSSGRPIPDGQQSGTGIEPADLFLQALVDKRRVYQGEPIIVEFKIYTRVQISSYSVTQPATTAGFWVEEYPLANSPQTSAEILNGQRYTVATLRKMAVYPTGSGTKTIDPMSIEAQVRVQRRSRDLFDDFFGGGSLFGRMVSRVAASEPIEIEVLPLPDANKPSDFSGHVGSVQVTTSVDRTEVETDEPITLRVTLSGTGNLRTIPDPIIDFPTDFDVYPPESNDQLNRGENAVTGTKTYDYLLVPRGPGARVIPSVTLSYFDPSSESYRRSSTDPISIDVTGDPVTGTAAVGRGRSSVRTLREDIRFIQTSSGTFRPIQQSPFSVAFWTVLVAPLAVLGGAWATRRHRDKLEGDVAYARRRRASKQAKKKLAKARTLMDPESQQQFYAETGKALLGFLSDKLNIAEAGVVREDTIGTMRIRSVSEETISEFFACVDVCDRQRFSPAATDKTAMNTFLTRATTTMSNLEHELSS